MTDRRDPYAELRDLDGHIVTARAVTPVEDVDGHPAGVEVEEYEGLLILPAPPDAKDVP